MSTNNFDIPHRNFINNTSHLQHAIARMYISQYMLGLFPPLSAAELNFVRSQIASNYNRPNKVPEVDATLNDPTTPIRPIITKEEKVSRDRLGLTAKNHKRHIARHHYNDHAGVEMDNDDLNTKRKAKGGVAVPFPVKLHQILDDIERDDLAHVVSWQSHGRAFVVHKPKQFVECILPKYFKQSNIRSFQRQLNRYGFSRLFSGEDKGGYYHELFLRGKPFLSERIECMRVKGTKVRGLSNPETEPDFYSMLPVTSNYNTSQDPEHAEKSS